MDTADIDAKMSYILPVNIDVDYLVALQILLFRYAGDERRMVDKNNYSV